MKQYLLSLFKQYSVPTNKKLLPANVNSTATTHHDTLVNKMVRQVLTEAGLPTGKFKFKVVTVNDKYLVVVDVASDLDAASKENLPDFVCIESSLKKKLHENHKLSLHGMYWRSSTEKLFHRTLSAAATTLIRSRSDLLPIPQNILDTQVALHERFKNEDHTFLKRRFQDREADALLEPYTSEADVKKVEPVKTAIYPIRVSDTQYGDFS